MSNHLEFTLIDICGEFHISDNKLRGLLRQQNVNFGPGSRFTIKQVHDLLCADPKQANARLATARAIEQEMLNLEQSGEMIPLARNLAWQESVLSPLRQVLLAMPGAMANRCNPTDPNFAQAALDQWVDTTLSILRKEITEIEIPENLPDEKENAADGDQEPMRKAPPRPAGKKKRK